MAKKLTFNERVLAALTRIPRGRIVTYKILAQAVHRPRAARAAGNAVAQNTQAPQRPCHRVIRSDGRLGGYSGRGGLAAKIKLLRKEGIKVRRGRVENFSGLLYNLKAK